MKTRDTESQDKTESNLKKKTFQYKNKEFKYPPPLIDKNSN